MRIAIVEDDEEARGFLDTLLKQAGHTTVLLCDGREAITALSHDTFDLVLIDWQMPQLSGIDVLLWMVQNMPVRPPTLMMTSRSDEKDIVRGLEAGADDYLVKPSSPTVILARVSALLCRPAPPAVDDRYEDFGDYHFDNLNETVTLGGLEVILTSKEYSLAKAFFSNPGRALARSYVLETLWKETTELEARALDVHVSRIRQKLKISPENGWRLQTVFGFGYRLEGLVNDAGDEAG